MIGDNFNTRKYVGKGLDPLKIIEEVSILPSDIPFYIILLKHLFKKARELGIHNVRIPMALFFGDVGIGKSEQVHLAANLCARIEGKIFVDLVDIEKNIKSGNSSSTSNLLNDILKNPDKYFLFLDLRLSTIEPYDLQGIIREREIEIDSFSKRVSEYIPFLWTYLFTQCEGILFLDEITHVARDDILSAAYQITYDHKTGEYAFHENVIIVAAGNLPHQTSVARPLDRGLRNRSIIFYVKNTPEAFLEYMRLELSGKDLIRNVERSILRRLKRTIDDSLSIEKYRKTLQRIKRFIYMHDINSRKKVPEFMNFSSWRTLKWFIILSSGVKDPDVIKRIAVGLLGEDGMKIVKVLDPNFRRAYRQKVRRMKRLLDGILKSPKKYVSIFSDIERMTEFFETLGEELNRLWIEKSTTRYRNLLQKTADMLGIIYESRDYWGYTDIIPMLIRNIQKQVIKDLVEVLRKKGLDGVIKYIVFYLKDE